MERTPLPDPNDIVWRKSTRSNQAGGDCVEVADGFRTVVPVRDSKTPHSPALRFTTAAWTTFTDGLKSGHRRP
ncbi:DUF397 domain-containing protein [Streptomyces sudanensis]|uniref:DUF397 domain-containing protein n=1 Tax=Streptomyces sudanensis TaxID=436397 RepID=UPI0020CFCD88|nr:DUF397 domain-containing protein [Streptomyces sudanensis]MCP9958018.1 DUF397 domain-containing protein [Streptomyces sudanensis]MCQ0001454.1 DUF397 domain-containing protein [Streptomyces sudanensis]